jgi:hypothetical protein
MAEGMAMERRWHKVSFPPKPGQSIKVDKLSFAEVKYLRKEERNE